MKKLAVLCITALGAALLVVGIAPPASAYPELTCSIEVDSQTVSSGGKFTVTGTSKVVDNARAAATSTTWTFEWNGVTKTRTGVIASATFTAPETTKTRKIPLTATVTGPDGSCVRTLDITVLGSAVAGPTPDDDDVLPGTGGPAFWLLVAALALLLVGGGTVVVNRRRS